MTELPDYFFRIRENGAVVFRIAPETRLKRIEMEQIAVVNVKNGEVKPHGDRVLSDQDQAEIDRWMTERTETLAQRQIDDILRTVDTLNLTAAWAQSKATPEELDRVADALLLAMHDLRAVLVRKKADRITKDRA